MNGTGSFHAVTWLVWAVAAALCVQVAANPLVDGLVLVLAWATVQVHGRDGPLARAFPVLVAVGVLFGVVKVVLTVLTTHGIGAAIVTLPELTLPGVLGGFTVGGTLEDLVLARAVNEALTIVAVMGVFGAFNAVVSHDELVRSLPRAFHELGLVLTVGLTFVPATITTIRQVQESDRARTGGTVVRRGRLVRLAVPVLERGIERAILLSESMDARGFGRAGPTPADRGAAGLAGVGVAALGAALIALVGRREEIALVLVVLAVVALGAGVVVASAATGRVRYRPRSLTALDALVMLAAIGGALGMIAATAAAGGLGWPGPRLAAPGIVPGAVAALALLAVPAVVGER